MMKKGLSIEVTSVIEEVKAKIWSMFDILRSEISADEFHVVLYLLSAYKDGLITESVLSDTPNLKDKFFPKSGVLNDERTETYVRIYNQFESTIRRLSRSSLESLLHSFMEIDEAAFLEAFPHIFDSVLYRIADSQGRHSGEFVQPVEITRLMCALAELKPHARVYNPFAGVASFAVYLDKTHYYFGQELNPRTWALGALRLMAYDRCQNATYKCEDSVLHWSGPFGPFDLVIANPPFAIRRTPQYRGLETDFRTFEEFLIKEGMNSLKEDGKLIALLPQSFFFRGPAEGHLAERLVTQDLIDTIISLPGGLLFNTGIPLVIIVISQRKKLRGKVKFVNAEKFVAAKNARERILNDEALIELLLSNDVDKDVVRVVSNDEIRSHNYNLNFGRYFHRQVEGTKLREILQFVRGRRSDIPTKGKLVQIRHLKDDNVDFLLDLEGIEETDLRRPDVQLISESCILVAKRWKTLKPTFFQYTGVPIFTTSDILQFKLEETIVDKAYLINELHTDYVKEQLDAYRLGASVMPFIRKDDLLEVVVKLPSLEEQKAKAEGIFEITSKIKNLQKDRDALAHGKVLSEFSEFASLKHTLGRPRQNILDWSDNLIHFLNENRNALKELNQVFAGFYDLDIIAALQEIKRDVNFITEVLEKGEKGFVLDEHEKRLISLSDINGIVSDLSNNGFNFRIKKLLLKSEKIKERGIYANRILFKTLLDNLLTNANKHAFRNKAAGNEVVIELTEVDAFFSLEVKNNGKPFPKNFDREKFIAKFSTASTSGSGLGGYDIHRIASDFQNPDWQLVLNEDPIYPVQFKFQFPIRLIN